MPFYALGLNHHSAPIAIRERFAFDPQRVVPALQELCGGVAFLETFASEDDFHGDHDGFQQRPARWYRRQLREAGFRAIGSHCWLGSACADEVAALEST